VEAGILSAIISGIFGLIGIWLQHRLAKRPSPSHSKADSSVPPKVPTSRIRWLFVLQWVLACSLVEGALLSIGDDWMAVSIPATQSIVLAREVRWAWWWLIASIGAWFATWSLAWNVRGPFSHFSVYIPLLGVLFGVFQWLVIRRRLNDSWLWLISSPVSWAVGSLPGLLLSRDLGDPAYALGFAVAGLLSGISLDKMLRHPDRTGVAAA
jgi:hypothetical protein